MNCRRVQRSLLRCPDRARGDAVARHLGACSSCRGYAETLAEIIRPDIMPLRDPGEPLVRQTLAGIRRIAPCGAGRRQGVCGRLLPLTAPVARAVGAAAILMIAAVLLWQTRRTAHRESAPSAALPPEVRIAAIEEQLRIEAAWIDASDPTADRDEPRGPAAWPEIGDDELDLLAEVFDEIAG